MKRTVQWVRREAFCDGTNARTLNRHVRFFGCVGGGWYLCIACATAAVIIVECQFDVLCTSTERCSEDKTKNCFRTHNNFLRILLLIRCKIGERLFGR